MTESGLSGTDAFSGAGLRFDDSIQTTGTGTGTGTLLADPVDIGGGTTAAPLFEAADLSMYDGSQETSVALPMATALAAGGLMGHGFKEGNWANRVGTRLSDSAVGKSMGIMRETGAHPKPSAQDLINDSLGRPADSPLQPGNRAPAIADNAAKAATEVADDAGKAASKGSRVGNLLRTAINANPKTAVMRGGLKAAKAGATGARNMVSAGINAAGRTAAARAMAPMASRLGARALAMAAAAAVPGPGWALAVGIGVTIALELVFNDQFRTWVGNLIRGGGLDGNTPPSPPETNFLPVSRDERDETIRGVDERISAYNKDLIDIDPKDHRLWDINNPGIDRLRPMETLVTELNEKSAGLNDVVANVASIYSGDIKSQWVGDQLQAMEPELELMSTFGEEVARPVSDAALHSAAASNDVFQAIREANAKSRDAIARSQGKWLSSVPMVSGVGRATVDENLLTDNADKIENKIREADTYAKKVEKAAQNWGVHRPTNEREINRSGMTPKINEPEPLPLPDPEPPLGGGPAQPLPGTWQPRNPGGPGWGGNGGGGNGGDDTGGGSSPFDPAPGGNDDDGGLPDYGTGFGGGDGFGDPATGLGGGSGSAFGGDTSAPLGDYAGTDPYSPVSGGGFGLDPVTGTSSANPFGDDSFDDLFQGGDTDPFGDTGTTVGDTLGADVGSGGTGLDDVLGGADSGDAFGEPPAGGDDPAGADGSFDPFGDPAEDGGEGQTGNDEPGEGSLFGDSIAGGTSPGGGEGAFGSVGGGSAGPDAGQGAFGSTGDPADSGSLFQGTDLSGDPAGSPWGSPGDTSEMDPERVVEINGEPVEFVSEETAAMVNAALDPASATDGVPLRELAERHGLELPAEGEDIGSPISPAEMQPGDVLVSEGRSYMYVGGEEAMDLSTGETSPLSDVAVFSGEHEGIFRLPGAEGEDLVPHIGGSVGDLSLDGEVTAESMSNTSPSGEFARTDEAPIGMGAGQNVPGGASGGDAGSSMGDTAAPSSTGSASSGGISEVPYEGTQLGGPGVETLGPQEGEIDSSTIGGASSATPSTGSTGSSAPQGLDPSRVTGGS